MFNLDVIIQEHTADGLTNGCVLDNNAFWAQIIVGQYGELGHG
jgi:hypothetical protein